MRIRLGPRAPDEDPFVGIHDKTFYAAFIEHPLEVGWLLYRAGAT